MTVALAVELLLALLARSAEISALIQKLAAEGRSEFTPEEWQKITDENALARQNLVNAIAAAKARETPPPPPSV